MRADDLIRSLERHFRRDYVVAAFPDHPHLDMGPDILIAGEENLVAGFALKKNEQNNSNLLYSRLALSRLALPDQTRCVLLCPEGRHVPSQVELNFHEVFTDNYEKSLSRFVADKRTGHKIGKIPEEIKARAILRYELLYSESLKGLLEEQRQRSQIEISELTNRAIPYHAEAMAPSRQKRENSNQN